MIDFAKLQFPPLIKVDAGVATPLVFGRFYSKGSSGANPQVKAQLGYGPFLSDPAIHAGWVWVDATFNALVDNDAEYCASLVSPSADGRYSFTYRFGTDDGVGIVFTYADLGGVSPDGNLKFDPTRMGILDVGDISNGEVSIADTTAAENDAKAVFSVTRTGSTIAFAVDFATRNGTALAGADFVQRSGTLNFGQGERQKTVEILLIDDGSASLDKDFSVILSKSTDQVEIVQAIGTATLVDDDIGTIGFAQLQFPQTLTARPGEQLSAIFGRAYVDGITDAAGASTVIVAQLGYGDWGSDPVTDAGWVWTDAAFNTQVGLNDEYQATFVAPKVAGRYAYTYRFAMRRGNKTSDFTYADLDGNGSNAGLSFDPNKLGLLDISQATPPPVNAPKRSDDPSKRFKIVTMSKVWKSPKKPF